MTTCQEAQSGPSRTPALGTVPVLRSSVKNVASRPGHGFAVGALRYRCEICSSSSAIRSSVFGSVSPSWAVRRMVSAIDCTAAEETGCGNDATAPSIAVFMTPMVSGANEALAKSFMGSALMLLRTRLAAILRRQPVQQRAQARRQRQALGIQGGAKPIADLPADRGVMDMIDLHAAWMGEICHGISFRFLPAR